MRRDLSEITDRLYTDIGPTIKRVTRVVCIILCFLALIIGSLTAVASFVGGLVYVFIEVEVFPFFIGILLCVLSVVATIYLCLAIYCASLIPYGIGQLIENSQKLVDRTCHFDVEKKRDDEEKAADLDAENKAQIEAEKQALIEAERQAQIEAERQAQIEAEKQARIEAERQARIEAEKQARIEAERQAQIEAEKQARIEAEKQARIEAEKKAQIEAERKAKIEAERNAKIEAERKAKIEAENKARLAAIERARREEEYRKKIQYEPRTAEEAALWEKNRTAWEAANEKARKIREEMDNVF